MVFAMSVVALLAASGVCAANRISTVRDELYASLPRASSCAGTVLYGEFFEMPEMTQKRIEINQPDSAYRAPFFDYDRLHGRLVIVRVTRNNQLGEATSRETG